MFVWFDGVCSQYTLLLLLLSCAAVFDPSCSLHGSQARRRRACPILCVCTQGFELRFDVDRLDLSTLIFTHRLYLVPGLPKGKPSSAGRPARAEREFRGDARSIAGDRRRLGPLLSGLVLSC